MTLTTRIALIRFAFSPLAVAALVAALAATLPRPALAADPNGTWLTEAGTSRIKIADCGGALCGNIVWLKDPNDAATQRPLLDKNNPDAAKRVRPLMGVTIVIGMKPSGADKWAGQVYNAEDGKTYTGNITMQGANALRLEGCALGGLICKGQIWTRVN
jgi:uncharacterized protein (DUF2147 family)